MSRHNSRSFPEWLEAAGLSDIDMIDLTMNPKSKTSIEAFLSWAMGLSPETYFQYSDEFEEDIKVLSRID